MLKYCFKILFTRPSAEHILKTIITLPTHEGLTEEHIKFIIKSLKEIH